MEMSWTCPENSSILWAFHARNQRLFPVSSHPILLPPAVAGAPQAAMTTATPRTSFGPGRRCWDRPWGWLPGGKTTLGKCHGSLADQKHSKSNDLSDLGTFKGLGWKKKWLQHYIGLGWWGTSNIFLLDSWDGEILDSMVGKQDVFCIEIKRLPVNIIQQINDAERIKACYMVPTWDVRDMT